jgi:hypothetical protein
MCHVSGQLRLVRLGRCGSSVLAGSSWTWYCNWFSRILLMGCQWSPATRVWSFHSPHLGPRLCLGFWHYGIQFVRELQWKGSNDAAEGIYILINIIIEPETLTRKFSGERFPNTAVPEINTHINRLRLNMRQFLKARTKKYGKLIIRDIFLSPMP